MGDDAFEPQVAILHPAAMERVRRHAEEQGVGLLSRPAAGCGKTPAGGWHCEGSGCLDAGRVCMHDAAAPAGTLTLVLGSTDSLFASGGFTVVSREALGLRPPESGADWAEEAAKLDEAGRLMVLSLYRDRRRRGRLVPAQALASVYEALALSCIQAVLEGGWLDVARQRARQCAYLVTLRQQLTAGASAALRRLRSL